MIRHLVLASLSTLIAVGSALAQTNVPNPLRPAPAERSTRAQPKETPQAETQQAKPADPAKPPRERSAKQRQNDDDMRACGASWRSDKANLTAKGVTWRSYLKDCRAAKKAGREKV